VSKGGGGRKRKKTEKQNRGGAQGCLANSSGGEKKKARLKLTSEEGANVPVKMTSARRKKKGPGGGKKKEKRTGRQSSIPGISGVFQRGKNGPTETEGKKLKHTGLQIKTAENQSIRAKRKMACGRREQKNQTGKRGQKRRITLPWLLQSYRRTNERGKGEMPGSKASV